MYLVHRTPNDEMIGIDLKKRLLTHLLPSLQKQHQTEAGSLTLLALDKMK